MFIKLIIQYVISDNIRSSLFHSNGLNIFGRLPENRFEEKRFRHLSCVIFARRFDRMQRPGLSKAIRPTMYRAKKEITG